MSSVRFFEEFKKNKRLKIDDFRASKIKEEKSKSSYNSPFFVIRRNVIDEDEMDKSKELIRNYHFALFKASIKALQCDVLEVFSESQNAYTKIHPEYSYVRDPVVILHDLGLMLSTAGNKEYLSDDIIKKIQEKSGYRSVVVKNSYFEGGNIFYSPQKKYLFHGLNPDGHYSQSISLSYFYTSRAAYYKIDPEITTKNLSIVLKDFNVKVEGLRINQELIFHNESSVITEYYYHLDCFMQLLPDGRLIILNKKILDEESQKKLIDIFGDDFIDLAYPYYRTHPILLNFVTIPNEDHFVIVSPTLPDSVMKSLKTQGLEIITPETLTWRNKRFDLVFTKRVVKQLEKDGFVGMTCFNLATHLAINQNGYYLNDGKKVPASWVTKLKSIDQDYQKEPIQFIFGGGGPHCLTNEVKLSCPMGAKKTSLNRIEFFKRLPRAVPLKMLPYNVV